MSYTVELPDGKVVEFPDSVSREQAAQIIRQQLGTGAAPKTGLGAALSKGAANLLSSGRTGIESLFGDATQAGRAGVARGEETARKYADQVSLDRVTDAYKQRGFLPAVGEAISQIPAALAEQAPNIAATAGGAFTGARLGALAGPVGAVVGGGIGALVPSFVQQFGSNVERQVQEAPGQPVSTGRAAAAGAGQAVLDVAATAIPLGKTILGKILGSKVEQAFLRGDKAAAEALAKESLPKVLAKGTGVGVAAEAPTEVVQAVLERAQAGLPLTSDDALKEYAENAYGAALLSPIGAAGRVTDRSSARDTLESESKKRAIEEARKLKESPEYIQKIATEYEAAQAAFNEAKQGLGKYPKKGTEVEKLEWREKYKQLGLLQNEISDLAPEYRELKPKIDEMRSREQAEAKAAEDAMWMGLRGEAPQGTPETEAPKLVDISALEEALTKEKNATTSEIENAWMEGAGRRRRTPIEEAVYDAVTAAVLDADLAAAIVETALKEGRSDLALYAAKRAVRAADSMLTTPGVSEGSPKYESIKKNLVESKQKAQAAARQLLEKATSTAAPVAPPAPANPYEEIGQGIARAYEQRRRAAAPPEQADWENLGVTTPLSAEARKDRNEFVVQQGVAAAQANPELAQDLLESKGKLEIPGLTAQDTRAIYDALNRQAKEDAAQQKRAAKAKPAPSTFSLTSSPQQANENLISSARDLQQPNREVVEAEREALLRMGAKPAEGPTALLKKVFGQKDDLTQKSPDLQFVADQLMGQVPRVPPAAENIPGRQRQGLGRTPTRITLQEIVDQMRVKAKALSAARETQNSQAINALRDELADLRAKAQEAEANGGFLYTQPQEPTPEQEAFERTTDTRPVTFAPMATPIAPAAPKTGDTITIDGKPAAAGPAQVVPAGVTLFRGEPATGRKETVGGARFMSPDRKVAEMYAGKDGKISEESHSFKNLLDAPNWVAAKEKLGLGKQNTMADLVDAARDAGHDGVSFSTTNGREYIVIGKNEPAAPKTGQPQRVAQQPGPETALQAAQKKSVAERTELADKADQMAQTPGLPRARVNALRTLQRALLSGERDAKAAQPILERLSRGIETPAPPAEEPQTPTKTVIERRVATPEGVVADVAPAKKKDTERQTKQGLPAEVVVKRAEPLSDEELDREETRAARRAAIKTVQRKTEEAVQASEKAVDDIYATIDRQDLASVTYWSDKMQLEIAELEAASRAAGDDFPKADEAKLRRARTVLKQLEDSQKQLRAAANNAREGTEEKQAERRAAREAERLQAMDEAAKYFKVAEQQDELVALYQSRVNELRSDLISKLIDHNVAMQKIKDLKPIGRELLGVPLDALEDAVTQQRDLFTDAIERARVVRETVPKYLAAVEALDEQGGVGTSDAEANSMRATADLLQAQLKYTDEELDLLNRTFETTRAARDVGRLQKQLLSADDVKPTEAELDEYQRALSKAQEREATARAKASEAERTLTRLASEDRLAQEKAAEAARDARLARERQQAEALIEAKERGAGTQYRMLNPVERAFREGAFDVSEEIEQLRAEAIAAGVPKKQLLAQEKRTRQKSDVVSLNRSLGVARKDLAKVEKAIQEGEASVAKAPINDESGLRVAKLQKQLESLEVQFAKERSAEKRAELLKRINSLQDRIKNRTTGRDPAIEARLKQLREQQAEAEAAATEAVGQEERMQTRADAYLDRNERVPQILVDAIQVANMRWRAAETQSEALQEKIRQLEDTEPAKQAFKGQGALMRQRKLLEVRIAEYLDRLQDLGLSETDVAMGGAFEERRAEAARKKLQQAINERKQREAAAVAAGTGEQRMTKQEAKAELAQEKPATSGEALEKSQAKKRLKGEKTQFKGTSSTTEIFSESSSMQPLTVLDDDGKPTKVYVETVVKEPFKPERQRNVRAEDQEQARADRAAEKRVRASRAVNTQNKTAQTRGPYARTNISVYAELTSYFKEMRGDKVRVYSTVDAFLQTPEGAKYVGKIPSNTKGVVLPEGKALLFADNIPEGRALGVLLHEVGAHLGFRKIFTAPELKALANVVRNWATRADNSVERKVGQAALKRVEDAKTPANQVDEEIIAYAVEEATNAGKAPSAAKGPVNAWLNRIREKFVAALEKFVGRYNKGTLKLSAQDLVDMAYGAANMELRGVEPAPRKGVMGSPDVMMSKAMRAFTQTPEFKRWFAGSKVVDAEGRPLVVYHGTATPGFSEFDPKQARSEGGAFFFSHSSLMKNPATNANGYATRRGGAVDDGAVMPVYLRMTNPLIAGFTEPMPEGDEAIVQWLDRMQKFNRKLDANKNEYYERTIKEAKRNGHDGVIFKNVEDERMDGGRRWNDETDVYAAFRPEQIKSAIGNNGGFDPSNPDIRFSLGAPTELMFSKNPKYSTDKAAAMGRIAESLVAPQKSMVDRIKLNALGLRTQLVDAMAPVEKFAEYLGKQTEDALRATQLMYNVRMHGETSHFMGLAASTGVVRRQEVKRDDGRTEYILRAEEGANLKDVMRELKDVPGMDPEAANINYSMHRIVKRYRGLSKRKPGATLESLFGTDAEGNPVVSMAKVLEFEKLLDESPDVKAAFERADAIYDQYNKDLMRFLAQSSAISPELADELTRYNDYVPYYRVRNGNVELVVEGMKEGPIRIGNIKDQPHLKELVGGNAAILDFSTSAVNNTHMLLDMGLRNYAARSVAWELKKMGMGAIGSDKVAGEDVFFFYEKGELRSMRVATDALGIPADLLVKGMAGIPMMRFAALQMLGLPARILRQAVVLNPVYALRQVLRDSPASMLVAGANGIPVLSAVQNLKRGPTRDLLERSGVTGGQVYTGSTEDIGMVLRTVNDGKASWMQALRKLESMSMTADAATRAAQYNSYRKQGLSDMEATFMSMESMNFSKRGLSPSMHMVSTMIPFFNAQIQGLDVLYKAARGKMPLNERLKIRQKLFVRGAMLAAGTLAYAALMQDEDEYKNALPEEKYNNWFVRIPGVEPMVRIPIPFELGYIFKAMPEAAFNLLNGSEEGRTVAKAFGTIVKNTIPGGSSMLDVKGVPIPIPLPQAMKPAIEAALGKSFFTGRDIESAPERAMDPEKRVRDTTSGLAKELGELGGFSPVMIDYILRGYLSSIGPLLAQTVSLAIPTGDSPERVVRRLNEYPLVGPLFQPKDGTGVINLVYDRVNEIERAKKTFDDLVSKGNRAEAQQYLRENIDRLSMEGLAGNFTQVMKQVSQAEAAVRAAVGVKSISPQEGREILDKLRQRKIQIAESVKSQMAVRKELQAAR